MHTLVRFVYERVSIRIRNFLGAFPRGFPRRQIPNWPKSNSSKFPAFLVFCLMRSIVAFVRHSLPHESITTNIQRINERTFKRNILNPTPKRGGISVFRMSSLGVRDVKPDNFEVNRQQRTVWRRALRFPQYCLIPHLGECGKYGIPLYFCLPGLRPVFFI